jgi:hypothetical protein
MSRVLLLVHYPRMARTRLVLVYPGPAPRTTVSSYCFLQLIYIIHIQLLQPA